MRKIITTEFYTLDGFMSDPENKMEWVSNSFDPELGKYEDDLYAKADTLFLGRITYKIFENYWPKALSNPDFPKEELEMASKINSMTKIVFSKSLKTVEWKNSKILNEIKPQEIKAIKKSPGKDILIVGSASIIQQLTNFGLIDEYHLVLHPVILSKGKNLFKNIEHHVNLNLLKTIIFQNGVVLLCYQKI
jgi:dihydrofolate reductase